MEKEFSALTDQELLEKSKKIKSNNLISAVLIGCMIGIAVYSSVKNGFGFFTFFPLFFLPIFINNNKKNKAVENEVKRRNLN